MQTTIHRTLGAAFALLTLTVGLFSITAEAALVSRLNGQAVYDTDLNITWLADANLAASNTFGLATGVDLGPVSAPLVNYGPSTIYSYIDAYNSSSFYVAGTMTWGGAIHWINAMNAANYLGFHDWRLPTTDCLVAQYCTAGEMGHLFYNELGGVEASSITTIHNTYYYLFQNVSSGYGWSAAEYALDTNYARLFHFGLGYQNEQLKNSANYAWVVRSGDVAAVPVPRQCRTIPV